MFKEEKAQILAIVAFTVLGVYSIAKGYIPLTMIAMLLIAKV